MNTYRTLVDCQELARHLADPGWVIFDCRFDLADPGWGREDYLQAHIPGARYAHLDEHLSGPITPSTGRHPLPDATALCDWLGDQGVSNESQVIVYDDTGGGMAARLWWLLRWLGHDRVAILDGGWPAWARADLPTSAEVPDPLPAKFNGTPNPSMMVDTRDLERRLAAGDVLLIDGRARERFTGIQESIDPVAGHIPGAVNQPFAEHLTPDGHFRPAIELRALYTDLLADNMTKEIACMCGSGVTACHNLLALELAGYPGGLLYAGSWSEWIRDPARPVATD